MTLPRSASGPHGARSRGGQQPDIRCRDPTSREGQNERDHPSAEAIVFEAYLAAPHDDGVSVEGPSCDCHPLVQQTPGPVGPLQAVRCAYTMI